MAILKRLRGWLSAAIRWLAPGAAAWGGAALAVALVAAAVATGLLASYVLPDFAWQKLPAYVTVTGALFAAGALGLLVFGWLTRIGAAYRIALFVFAPLVVFVLPQGKAPAAPLFGVAVVLLASLVGGGFASLRARRYRPGWAAVAALALGVAGLAGGGYATFSDMDDPNPWLADYRPADRTLDLPNPGLPGDYAVATLTYGSGRDRRPEYGAAVDLVSRPVDGSKLVGNWDGLTGWLRTSYWGFDATALPLQGRAWYPVGDGPFPLVLVVHGNHSMEDYSDPGYAYLGELFASRGIILVSVDENFLNSSISASVDLSADRPGLEEENDARGWLLLEHLALWRDWNAEAGHAFEGKVDLEKLALIGHSRGGEAVAVAAAFNPLSHYPDDASVAFDFGFDLRGVIAIAPVDGQYEPREKPTPIRDVSYFTIHGSMDGDVQSFDGTAQYARVTFSEPAPRRFRASLFVEGANHGQFNTTWENLDVGPFGAWALDLERIMPAEEQRDVARVFFGAFLEIVLNGRDEYLPLFEDARRGTAWLPARYYVSQYADSTYRVLADFEEDIDPGTTTQPGGRIATAQLSRWYETANRIKYDDLDTHGAVFAWDDRYNSEIASVEFAWPGGLDGVAPGDTLVMSLAAADTGTLPDDYEPPADRDDAAAASDEPQPLSWTVELRDTAGQTAALPLDHDAPLYPLLQSIPRHARFLESEEPTEVLYRRYALPLADFAATNPAFDPAALAGIRFVFDQARRGATMIDDLGLAPARNDAPGSEP